jgi:hypothetical protein
LGLLGLSVPEEKRTLRRWHPKFDLEQVDDVEQSELESLIDEKVIKVNHILEQCRQQLSDNVSRPFMTLTL